MNIKQLLTIDELAVLLKVPKSWIYARCREREQGSMPRIKCGKYLRFDMMDIEKWLESRNV